MVSRYTTLVPSLGLRIGSACEVGLSADMRRERVAPQKRKKNIEWLQRKIVDEGNIHHLWASQRVAMVPEQFYEISFVGTLDLNIIGGAFMPFPGIAIGNTKCKYSTSSCTMVTD